MVCHYCIHLTVICSATVTQRHPFGHVKTLFHYRQAMEQPLEEFDGAWGNDCFLHPCIWTLFVFEI